MNSTKTLREAQSSGIAPWDDLVWDDLDVAVFRDRYPVAPGHLLFVPKYPGDLAVETALAAAFREGQRMLEQKKCDAFNVGINCGEAAGQTVMYPHVHLIPRKHGDCADPVGGVRGVIFGQANYKKTGYQQPASKQL